MSGAGFHGLSGDAAALSEDEIDQNYGYRERFETTSGLESADPTTLEAALPPDITNLSDEAIQGLISAAAHDLVLSYEVSGQSGYERKYKYPCWPGLQSGITIGIGYDAGYNTASGFAAHWAALLPQADFAALAQTVGKKGDTARGLLSSVKTIVVPWAAARAVYTSATVPTFAKLVLATFPNAFALHPDSFGALFSLVYNRGASLEGPRRQHMRNIRDHMAARDFQRIPKELRDMKSLWGSNMSGLHKRRESEAVLFEAGLLAAASQSIVSVSPPQSSSVVASLSPASEPPHLERASRDDEGDWSGHADDITADMDQPQPAEATLESTPGWMGVAWSEDEANTEYRHVRAEDRTLKDCEFDFTGRDLELLIRANAFSPLTAGGKIIFGLRGALLLGSTADPNDRLFQIDRAALRLKEARPDHATFRCVIGVYDLVSKRISGFTASTVAKRSVIYSYAKGGPDACNLLPGGCYTYTVGAHRGKAGCLRETEDYGVLRNKNNLSFDTKDVWDDCFPADNIHPGFVDGVGSAEFSSLGCQVIKGSINLNTKEHIGPWARFRQALGLSMPAEKDHGKTFSYVLLTGLEAALAVRLRTEGRDIDLDTVMTSLGRLRQGSRGEHVKRLQAALSLPVTGVFDSKTKVALAKHQLAKAGAADGVYSPALDQQLGFKVFLTAPAEPVAIARLEGLENTRDPVESLYFEIGRRAVVARTNPGLASDPNLPHLETVTTESFADLMAIGQRLFVRLERSAFELLCGDGEADQADRQSIQSSLRDAAKLGTDQLIDQLTNVLVTGLGVINPIAAIVAKILVTKVLEPAIRDSKAAAGQMMECSCRNWAKDLNTRVAGAGIQSDPAVALSATPAPSLKS